MYSIKSDEVTNVPYYHIDLTKEIKETKKIRIVLSGNTSNFSSFIFSPRIDEKNVLVEPISMNIIKGEVHHVFESDFNEKNFYLQFSPIYDSTVVVNLNIDIFFYF